MTAGTPRLDLGALLDALARHRVENVITGSVAAMAYGVECIPGDLDIAPALTNENLKALAGLLRELGAKPKHVPTWKRGLSLEECERWAPEPADEARLDHRFVTPHGDLDVVPRLAGLYDDLMIRALATTAFGVPVRVAHPDDLIALCEKWDRETDRRRWPALVAARVELARNPLPHDIGPRLCG